MSPQDPDEVLCEAEKMEDGGTSTAAAGAGDVDVVVKGLAKGKPKTDVGFFPCSPMFDIVGADVYAPKGEKDMFAFANSRRIDKMPAEPEALGTEEVKLNPEAKAEVKFCR